MTTVTVPPQEHRKRSDVESLGSAEQELLDAARRFSVCSTATTVPEELRRRLFEMIRRSESSRKARAR